VKQINASAAVRGHTYQDQKGETVTCMGRSPTPGYVVLEADNGRQVDVPDSYQLTEAPEYSDEIERIAALDGDEFTGALKGLSRMVLAELEDSLTDYNKVVQVQAMLDSREDDAGEGSEAAPTVAPVEPEPADEAGDQSGAFSTAVDEDVPTPIVSYDIDSEVDRPEDCTYDGDEPCGGTPGGDPDCDGCGFRDYCDDDDDLTEMLTGEPLTGYLALDRAARIDQLVFDTKTSAECLKLETDVDILRAAAHKAAGMARRSSVFQMLNARIRRLGGESVEELPTESPEDAAQDVPEIEGSDVPVEPVTAVDEDRVVQVAYERGEFLAGIVKKQGSIHLKVESETGTPIEPSSPPMPPFTRQQTAIDAREERDTATAQEALSALAKALPAFRRMGVKFSITIGNE